MVLTEVCRDIKRPTEEPSCRKEESGWVSRATVLGEKFIPKG